MIILTADEHPLCVGHLPPAIVLPILTGTREVRLTYQSYRHIIERRENEKPEHIALVLERLRTVLADPSHFGCLSGEGHKLDLFAWQDGDFAGVLVSLKCLAGETWVNTAFPLGRKTLKKHLATGRLTGLLTE